MQTTENTQKNATLEYVLTDAERDVLQKLTAPVASGILAEYIQRMLLPIVNASLTGAVALLRAQHGMSPNAQPSEDLSRIVEPKPEKE